MSTVRCPHCGTANRAGSNFCNGCGTDLRDPDARPDTPPAAQPASPADPQRAPRPDEPRADEAPAPTDATPSRRPAPGPRPPEEIESEPVAQPEPPAPPLFVDQPWLGLEFDAEDRAAGEPDIAATEARLITGVQGLLAPVRIAANIADDEPARAAPAPLPATTDLAAEQVRLIRALMSEPPLAPQIPVAPPRAAALRVPWVFLLLGLAIALPALFAAAGPIGEPYRWPGVETAHTTIERLLPGAFVTVYWAYDPATAGEMDLVMRPVVRHLLDRRVRLAVVSTLPAGPATARRLFAAVRDGGRRPAGFTTVAEPDGAITYSFLPGGAGVLPLLARDPAAALLDDRSSTTSAGRNTLLRTPDLVVVAAAHAEDVQHWLEQVQPLTGAPVIAVTGAGADPLLRPYLDSRQLWGLVSGFDGAYAYQQILEPFAPAAGPEWLTPRVILQNWGQLAFVAVIVLGNLAALLSRGGGQ